MKQAYSCAKCLGMESKVGQIRTTGSGLSRIFNLHNQKYATVSCIACGYTELYKLDGKGVGNVIDFLSGQSCKIQVVIKCLLVRFADNGSIGVICTTYCWQGSAAPWVLSLDMALTSYLSRKVDHRFGLHFLRTLAVRLSLGLQWASFPPTLHGLQKAGCSYQLASLDLTQRFPR